MNNFKWPLNDSHFTMWDRLRIAKFFLTPKNRWTQGELVRKYEQEWKSFVGSQYAVMTSSGSTANTLMAMYVKDSLGRNFRTRNRVILPAITWQTSVSPWIREGFRPIFVDIDETSLCADTALIYDRIQEDPDRVACVFPTSLLGMSPIIKYLTYIEEDYPEIRLMFDNCENSFGSYNGKNLSSLYTSSTSMYFGHQATTGGEGGMIFTNNYKEFEYFLMARNHGMVRGLDNYASLEAKQKYRNPDVDERFDFNLLGNNYRSTDISAFIGLLDFEKIEKHAEKRKQLSSLFRVSLSPDFFETQAGSILFALPLIPRRTLSLQNQVKIKNRLIEYFKKHSIEYRPIISGNLLRHTAYKNYNKNQSHFPIAEHVHDFGLYVGLYPNLNEEKILDLVNFANNIIK